MAVSMILDCAYISLYVRDMLSLSHEIKRGCWHFILQWLELRISIHHCRVGRQWLGIDSMVPKQIVLDVVTRNITPLTYMTSTESMTDGCRDITLLGTGSHSAAMGLPGRDMVFPLSTATFVPYIHSTAAISTCRTRQLGRRLWSTMC